MALSKRKHTVVVIVDNRFSLIDLSCCVEVFFICNLLDDRYDIVYSSLDGGVVHSRSGLSVATERLEDIDPTLGDIVIIIGGGDTPQLPPPQISTWLRARAALCRLCGVGAGTSMLLQSLGFGVAPGRDQHRSGRRQSREGAPPVAIRVGPSWTCKGRTAALDLMLALVAEDLGRPQALRVAEELLMYVWRRTDEPLLSVVFELQRRGETRFPTLHDYIRSNLQEDLRIEKLADICGMSPRTFARLYRRETGKTPAAAVKSIRLEAAKKMVEGRTLSLAEISDLTGFGSELSLRRAFVRAFGDLPSRI